MKIAIGSDHSGVALKDEIKTYLESRKIAYEDKVSNQSRKRRVPSIIGR